jgi:hypothetical protein
MMADKAVVDVRRSIELPDNANVGKVAAATNPGGGPTTMGGAEGIRTPDPLDANEVRYQAAPQPRNGNRQATTQ